MTDQQERERVWVVCDQCGGEGVFEDCFEDTCVCLDPPCLWADCNLCNGEGGWYLEEESDAF